MDPERRFVLVDLESEIPEAALGIPCSVNHPSESKPNDPMPAQSSSGTCLYNDPYPYISGPYANPSNELPSTSYGTFQVYQPLPPFPILPPLIRSSDRLRSKEARSLSGFRSTVYDRYSSKDSRLRNSGRKRFNRRPVVDTEDGDVLAPEDHSYCNFSLKMDEQKEPAPSTSTQTLPSCPFAAPTNMGAQTLPNSPYAASSSLGTQTTQNVAGENTNVHKNVTSSSTQTSQNVTSKKRNGHKNLKSSSTQTCHCPGRLSAIYRSGQTAGAKPPLVINVDVRITDRHFKDDVKAEGMRLDKEPADQ